MERIVVKKNRKNNSILSRHTGDQPAGMRAGLLLCASVMWLVCTLDIAHAIICSM